MLIDLVEIIQESGIDGLSVYSPIFGSGIVVSCGANAINDTTYPIVCQAGSITFLFDRCGRFVIDHEFDMVSIDCMLQPLINGEIANWQDFVNNITKKKSTLHVVISPFDKVLVRDFEYEEWIPALFMKTNHRDSNPANNSYKTIGEHTYEQCIPYNESNKKYMFTKESPNITYIIHDRKEEPAPPAEKKAGR